MKMYEEAWEHENKQREENYKRNKEYFSSLSDKEKFELMWKDYVEKHIRDIRH